MSDKFQNILIIKLKHLGDVLTTTPVVSGINKLWPGASISCLINPGGEDLVKFHPLVKEVFTFPRGGGLLSRLSLIKELRKRKFDLVLELSGGDRGAFFSRASGARVRVGYQPANNSRFDRRLFFTHLTATDPGTRHTVEYHLDALRVLGVEPGRQEMSLHWPPAAESTVRNHLAAAGVDFGADYAVVHPSSRWMFKTWRPEGNARVIDYLAEKVSRVIITAAPEPKEMDYIGKMSAEIKSEPLDLSGKLSLSEMAALISGALVFFGVDSLPMHMSAAVGTPAVVLFGPSGDHMWGPWGDGHHVVARDWECRPCGRDGCDGSKVSKCLEDIQAEEIFPILDKVLESR